MIKLDKSIKNNQIKKFLNVKLFSMKALILAGGYATRLFPLTENFPKPLLEINKKPMMDYILDKIGEIWINEIFVITNNKYYSHFENRANQKKSSDFSIKIINDHTLSNGDRLGGVWDIIYTIQQENLDDDLLVVWWDNLFKFSLEKSYKLFKEKNQTVIIWYDVQSLEYAKSFGIISIDESGKVVDFTEKPQDPKSTLAAICLYYYPKHILLYFTKYLQEADNLGDTEKRQKMLDWPWNFPARLYKQTDVYACVHTEKRYDVWTFDALKQATTDYTD